MLDLVVVGAGPAVALGAAPAGIDVAGRERRPMDETADNASGERSMPVPESGPAAEGRHA
jgi:hypothetical protein